MIRESIITTLSRSGEPHIVPMGVIWRESTPILAPFHPSRTLENLREHPYAVINHTDDVRVFAGGVTGRREWPVRPAQAIRGVILESALSHQEVAIARIEEDPVRPRFHCRVVHEASHAAFRGFNRAQAAVIEAAILVSRLDLLPLEKIQREMAYLAIAVEKTAGTIEREAWAWLDTRVQDFLRDIDGKDRS